MWKGGEINNNHIIMRKKEIATGSHKLMEQEACVHPLSLDAVLGDRCSLPSQ